MGKHPEPHIGRYSVADGILQFEFPARSFGPGPKTSVPFSWKGSALVLNEGTPQKFRARTLESEASQALEGMWKRDGEVPAKETSGVIFLPLNYAVLVGGSGSWDRHPGFNRAWQMCVYTCPEPNVLAEELDATGLGYGRYSRQRSFVLQDDTLTIQAKGQPDQVYRRVHGEFPFDGDGFNKAVWDSLKAKS